MLDYVRLDRSDFKQPQLSSLFFLSNIFYAHFLFIVVALIKDSNADSDSTFFHYHDVVGQGKENAGEHAKILFSYMTMILYSTRIL